MIQREGNGGSGYREEAAGERKEGGRKGQKEGVETCKG